MLLHFLIHFFRLGVSIPLLILSWKNLKTDALILNDSKTNSIIGCNSNGLANQFSYTGYRPTINCSIWLG